MAAVAFAVPASSRGETDLNGGGAPIDRAIHVLDPATSTAINTGLITVLGGVT